MTGEHRSTRTCSPAQVPGNVPSLSQRRSQELPRHLALFLAPPRRAIRWIGLDKRRCDAETVLLVATLQAHECSGDLVGNHTQHMYLACFGPDYGVNRHFFSFSKVAAGYVHKSGALVPLYDPMPVTDGYLIDFQPGDARAASYPLAARRAAP